MENGRIYDLETKQEVFPKDIEAYKMYLYVKNNFCSTARIVGFDESGNIINEKYMTYKEQLEVATDLIKAKYIKMGITDIEAVPSDVFSINNMKLQVPHIFVRYTNLDGEKVEKILNENTLEEMVKIDDLGNISISINNMVIGDNEYTTRAQTRTEFNESEADNSNKSNKMHNNEQNSNRTSNLLLKPHFSENSNIKLTLTDNDFQGADLAGLVEMSSYSNCRVSINQYGFKGEYDFSNPEDAIRFKNDIKAMPRTRAQSQRQSQEHETEDLRIK